MKIILKCKWKKRGSTLSGTFIIPASRFVLKRDQAGDAPCNDSIHKIIPNKYLPIINPVIKLIKYLLIINPVKKLIKYLLIINPVGITC